MACLRGWRFRLGQKDDQCDEYDHQQRWEIIVGFLLLSRRKVALKIAGQTLVDIRIPHDQRFLATFWTIREIFHVRTPGQFNDDDL